MLSIIKTTLLKPILLEIFNDAEIRTAFQNFFKNNDSSTNNINSATNVENEKIAELESKIKEQTKDLEVLQTSFNEISAEKDNLQISFNNIFAEKNKLENSFKEISAEKNNLQNSLQELQEDYDNLKENNTTLNRKFSKLQKEHQTLKDNFTALKNELSDAKNLIDFGVKNKLIYFSYDFYSLNEISQNYAFINKISQWQTILDIHQNLHEICEQQRRAINQQELDFLQRCLNFYNMNLNNKASLYTAEINENYDYDIHERSSQNRVGDNITQILLPGLKNANGDIIYPVLVVTK